MDDAKVDYSFEEVLVEELRSIQLAREACELVPHAPASAGVPGKVFQAAHAANLRGLAFSGGGIRSATFNLGVLQALAEARQLRQFDYLSTVSGGGYIGSWLSA